MAHQIARDPNGLVHHVLGHLPTKLISSGSVEYSVVLPADHDKDRPEPYPLVVSFHPAGQSARYLFDPEGAARTGRDVVPPRDVVWASFSNGTFGGYQTFADGSEEWERFFMEEFLPFIEETYGCGGDRSRRYLTGICMGGIGVLKYAFKHPAHFAAAAAQQPAIPCAEEGAQVQPWDLMGGRTSAGSTAEQRADNVRKFGAECAADSDPAFYREHTSPIAMAADHADEIRLSGLRIFIDAGDQDCFALHNAAELLHRTLWWLRIPHEYHLVGGADHMGSSWRRRGPAAMDFLFRAMTTELQPPELLTAEEREWVQWKKAEKAAAGKEPIGPEPARPQQPLEGHCVFSDKNGCFNRMVNMQPLQGTGGAHELNGEATTFAGSSVDGPAELMGHQWRVPRAESRRDPHPS